METITIMLEAISKLYEQQKKVKEKKREEGECFNVFNTIGLRTEEVRLHSAFIAELLNPDGSHGLSHRFLQAFLELIETSDDYIDYRRCEQNNIVERVIGPVNDMGTEGGRIDIIIEDGNHAVIIENKIYASDQKNQMLRYNNYAKKDFPNGYKLVYLSLDGHEPDDCSLGKDEYKVISYEKEIVEWLEKCYSISDSKPLVQSVIKQYCELVKQITNTDMDTTYKNNLMSIMLDPKNVIAVGEMLQLQDEWFGMILEKYIWNPLEKLAKQKQMLFGKELEIAGDWNGAGAWIYREEWKYYGIFIWTKNRKYWADMFVGVSWFEVPNRKNKISKKDRKDCKLNCLNSFDPNDEEWPYGWEFLQNDIRNWNYEIIDNIVQGKVFDYIKKKFEDIISEIDELQLRMP